MNIVQLVVDKVFDKMYLLLLLKLRQKLHGVPYTSTPKQHQATNYNDNTSSLHLWVTVLRPFLYQKEWGLTVLHQKK